MLPAVPVIRCPLWDRRGSIHSVWGLSGKIAGIHNGPAFGEQPACGAATPGRNLIVGTQRFDRGNGRGLAVAHHAVDDQGREHTSGPRW
jgi:hypothetical protein